MSDDGRANKKRRRRAGIALGALVPTVLAAGAILLQGVRLPVIIHVSTKSDTTTTTVSTDVFPMTLKDTTTRTSTPSLVLPEACRAYIIHGDTLSLKHGRFIHIPGRQAPYDHNTCFLMKPRYNCATNDTSSTPKAFEWKFMLQSNVEDESTICDIQAIVDEFGGPAAITNKQVALFGNSFLRQVLEAMACKYQDQLTRVLVTENPPSMSLAAVKRRGGKPLSMEEYGTISSIPLDKRPIPHCSGNKSEFSRYFHPGVNLSTPHFTDSCSDDLAMMEYNSSFKVYCSFHPERLQDTVRSYEKMIGLDMTELDYIAFQARGLVNHFRKSGAKASFDNYVSVVNHLKRTLKRDAGHWFGATNPWIVGERDPLHPCLPGIPDDEVAIFLFSVMFGIHKFIK